MIFDPELAAAAKRHARAQAKARQKLTAPAATATATGAGEAAGAASKSTPSSFSPLLSETTASATSSSGIANVDATLSVSRVIPQANRDAPVPSIEHESSLADKAVLGSSGGNKAVLGRNSSVGGSGNGGVGSARGGGLIPRTTSGLTSGDGEGGPRAGHILRSRVMKPRVLLKIVVLGSSNVGKTSLMKRYVASDFSEKRRPTIGADFMTKEMVAGDQPMLLQIWDTAGQERFHGGSLGSGFFRGANAALLVYDISCAVSFEQVAMWREELLVRLDVDPHDFPIVVIGNKVDLAQDLPMDGTSGVNRSRVLKWCEMQGMGHIETSAKEGSGVEVAMQSVAMLALAQKQKRDRDLALNPSLGGGSILHLADERARQQKKRGCCP